MVEKYYLMDANHHTLQKVLMPKCIVDMGGWYASFRKKLTKQFSKSTIIVKECWEEQLKSSQV